MSRSDNLCIAGGSVMSRITTRQLYGQLRRRGRTRRRGLADPAQVRDIVAVAVCSHLVPFLGDLPAALGRAEGPSVPAHIWDSLECQWRKSKGRCKNCCAVILKRKVQPTASAIVPSFEFPSYATGFVLMPLVQSTAHVGRQIFSVTCMRFGLVFM